MTVVKNTHIDPLVQVTLKYAPAPMRKVATSENKNIKIKKNKLG